MNKEHLYTHIISSRASRIDQLWISRNLASKILSYKVFEQMAIPTDHKQVTTVLDWFEYKPSRVFFSIKVYQFHEATKEQVQALQDNIELSCLTTSNSSWETLN